MRAPRVLLGIDGCAGRRRELVGRGVTGLGVAYLTLAPSLFVLQVSLKFSL